MEGLDAVGDGQKGFAIQETSDISGDLGQMGRHQAGEQKPS